MADGGGHGAEAALQALGLLKDLPPTPRMLDIGCGSGTQTLILAGELNTHEGLDIETRELSMMEMPLSRRASTCCGPRGPFSSSDDP